MIVLRGKLWYRVRIEFNADGIDTLGGWYFTMDIELDMNKEIYYQGYTFSIFQKESHHIQYIEVKKSDKPLADESVTEQIESKN